MLILLYLAVLGTALYYVSKVLGPEMSKTPTTTVRRIASIPDPYQSTQASGADNKMERLESLLAEKNKNISLLQNDLKLFQAQVRDYDKIKALLEEEIHRLREQNRIFRSELGMPTVQAKENSIT